MTLAFLEEAWGAEPIAQLARPGLFYDFTRYRPMLYRSEGRRQVSIPNTAVHFAPGEEHDWILLHALEPHANGEDYVDGLLDLIRRLGVRQYALIGSMYAPVPHTRPPITSGSASGEALQARLQRAGVRESAYEGPTTVLALLPAYAGAAGIETATLVMQLPAYAQLERDYRGLHAMLELLARLYRLSLNLETVREQGQRQCAAIDDSISDDAHLQGLVHELEANYDAEAAGRTGDDEQPSRLSPELEKFLRDVEQRWRDREGP
jgi:hypothetical protein